MSSGLHWLGEHAAFVELEQGYIEAAVRAVRPFEELPSWVADYAYSIDPEIFPPTADLPAFNSTLERVRYRGRQGRIKAENDAAGISVELSEPSLLADEFMSRLFPAGFLTHPWGGAARIATIKIRTSAVIKDRDDAMRLLASVVRSFSFDLDVRFSQGFGLCELAPWPSFDDGSSATPEQSPKQVGHPLRLTLNNYSEHGLSYYWNARRAASIPEAEYANYYKVLEYHFTQYAQAETVEFVRQRLKDPRFDSVGSESLARFASAISKQVKAHSAEHAMLRATLSHCIDLDLLMDFIESDKELQGHLANKNAIPGVPQILPSQRDHLVERLTERIYGIRNQLTHAKGENLQQGSFIMLPGSAEMKHLGQEIKLVRFVAQSVLIASSTKVALDA